MYPIVVFMILSGLLAAAVSQIGEQRLASIPPSAAALAQDFAAYRTAVIRYVQTHPDAAFSASVPNASLPSVGAYVAHSPWRNYVKGNTVVVYSASVPAINFVGALEELAQHSVFAGAAYNGTIVANPTSSVPSNVKLPPVVQNVVPNGVPVWEALDVF
jgi:hypothetical protein